MLNLFDGVDHDQLSALYEFVQKHHLQWKALLIEDWSKEESSILPDLKKTKGIDWLTRITSVRVQAEINARGL